MQILEGDLLRKMNSSRTKCEIKGQKKECEQEEKREREQEEKENASRKKEKKEREQEEKENASRKKKNARAGRNAR